MSCDITNSLSRYTSGVGRVLYYLKCSSPQSQKNDEVLRTLERIVINVVYYIFKPFY